MEISSSIRASVSYPISRDMAAAEEYVKEVVEIIKAGTPKGHKPVFYGTGTSTAMLYVLLYKYLPKAVYVSFHKTGENTHRPDGSGSSDATGSLTHWIVDDVLESGRTMSNIMKGIRARWPRKEITLSGIIVSNVQLSSRGRVEIEVAAEAYKINVSKLYTG